VDKVEQSPDDMNAIEKAYSDADFSNLVAPFIDKGKIDTTKFFDQTGIELSSNDPEDLFKWVRKLQTMQDFAKNYPQMAKLFDVQERRTGAANQMSIRDRKTVESYFELKKQDRATVDKALLYGDNQNVLLNNETLETKFKLSESMRKGYWAIRKVLDEKLQYILGQMVSDGLTERKGTAAEKEIVDVPAVVKAINDRNKARSKRDTNLANLNKKLSGKLSDLGLLPA